MNATFWPLSRVYSAFQNPEFKILADFNNLVFQNPEFIILGEIKILSFLNPESTFWPIS